MKRKTKNRKHQKDAQKLGSSECLNPRQRRYLEGVIGGQTKKSAALAAGYAESTAKVAAASIERPAVLLAFQELLRAAIPPDKIAKRLAEGLDALDIEFAKFEGRITDERALIAWSERRQYIELAAKLAGYYVERQEVNVDEIRKNLENRSTEELLYYDKHGCWPEEPDPVQ